MGADRRTLQAENGGLVMEDCTAALNTGYDVMNDVAGAMETDVFVGDLEQ